MSTGVTFTQLSYIVAVFNEGHFGRAAKSCHVSQPSLSSQIQKVEELLGFVIFDRSKKPIKVTEKGRALVSKANLILAQMRDLEHFAENDQEVGGDFKLGVIPTLAPYLIPLFIESFSKNYPKVNLRIYEHTTNEIKDKLYKDELDGALLVTPLDEDKIIERSLYLEPFCIYASEAHKFFGKKTIHVDEVNSDEELWLLSEGHCFRDQVLKVCSAKQTSQMHSNIFFESGSLETIKKLVAKGRGFSIIPQMAAEDIRSKVIPFSEPVPVRQVGLVHSRSFLKENILDALEKEILASLPKTVKNLKSFSLVGIN